VKTAEVNEIFTRWDALPVGGELTIVLGPPLKNSVLSFSPNPYLAQLHPGADYTLAVKSIRHGAKVGKLPVADLQIHAAIAADTAHDSAAAIDTN
jgi:hypothetical protein